MWQVGRKGVTQKNDGARAQRTPRPVACTVVRVTHVNLCTCIQTESPSSCRVALLYALLLIAVLLNSYLSLISYLVHNVAPTASSSRPSRCRPPSFPVDRCRSPQSSLRLSGRALSLAIYDGTCHPAPDTLFDCCCRSVAVGC